ncbi:MAG: murein biosynthesis integral membrane protein MurJ [Chloroflexi bacterium]|nr:murein biosynthesis integral membrane protein MurJ [Chloroflexota bacterium]
MASAAGIVALGFIVSRLLGVLRSVVIANAFGTDPELSAYWVAFRLPDLVFQLLAGATLSAAFIPTFSRALLRGGEEAGWRLASSVLNLVAVATFVAAGLAFLAAPVLVPWLAPGLGEATGREVELRALAIDLTRLMLISPLFFGISGMLMGILNARQHFAAPAFAPVIYNLGIIFGALFLAGPLGVHGLAWGVVAGSIGHMAVQAPALRGVGWRWHPTLALGSKDVRDVLRLMGPRVIGLGAAQINFLVIIFFASFVSDAAISAVNYAFLMMMLPVGVIGMAISTAVFPTLAAHAAAREIAHLRTLISNSLRVILFLSVPASVGLALLATPTVRVLLERGEFGPASTDLVVDALVLYSVGIAAHAGVEILSRGFYALSDTRTPVTIAVIAMALNVAFAVLLVRPFGVGGLAAAASLAALIEFGLLARLLDVRLGGLDRKPLRRSVGSTVIASIVMAQAVIIVRLLVGASGVDAASTGGALLVLLAATLAGALIFIAISARLHRDDYALVLRRLGR